LAYHLIDAVTGSAILNGLRLLWLSQLERIEMKIAIRIVDGATGTMSLFAVVRNHPAIITKYYNMARATFPQYSSNWVSLKEWSLK